MSSTIKKSSLAIAVSAACAANAWALDAQNIPVADGVVFTPTLQVSESYDDNFRAVNENEQSSWITTVTPTFTLAAEGRKTAYKLNYRAVSDTFHSSHSDNNTDHYLTADGALEFDARNRLSLNAGHQKVEETASENSEIENDKYTRSNVGGVYTFGAETARAQVDVGADYSELRYQNAGGLNADKERDTTALNSTLYYRISPKTRLLGEVRHAKAEYVSNTNLDNTSWAFLGGVTWEATALTTGTIKFGQQDKKFDSGSTHDDTQKTMWEAGVQWQPLTYSTFSLNTRQALDEGENGASAIAATSYTLGWEHQWLERLKSNASYTWSERDYEKSARNDKLNTAGIGLTYAMRRWLDVGVGYRYSDNDSTLASESFERNIYMLNVSASL